MVLGLVAEEQSQAVVQILVIDSSRGLLIVVVLPVQVLDSGRALLVVV